MKTIALLSGGKDSILAVLMAYRYGHTPSVIVNIVPALPADVAGGAAEELSETAEGGHDIDSYMYQTVGFEAVDAIAACLNVPLRRACVRKGRAKDQSLLYSEHPPEEDEVESLFRLLQAVKEEFPEVGGITSGAILSNYQRNRVEFICDRLGMESLAYLWMRQPAEILDMAHELHVQAILVKTASIGLLPRKLIGQTLEQARPTLEKMTALYQAHLAGEGGEYETTVLNCPLFQKERLVVQNIEVVMQDDNDISPSGHGLLTISREAKSEEEVAAEAEVLRQLRRGELTFPSDVMPLLQRLATTCQDLTFVPGSGDKEEEKVAKRRRGLAPVVLTAGDARSGVASYACRAAAVVHISSSSSLVDGVREDADNAARARTVATAVTSCLTEAQSWAREHNLTPFSFHVALPRSRDEAACCRAYSQCVSHVCPPALLLTVHHAESGKAEEEEVFLEVLAAPRDTIQQNVLHAQSRSCWALGQPGPYAQARRVGLPSGDTHLFVSATAGRVPATRELATVDDLPEACKVAIRAFVHGHFTTAAEEEKVCAVAAEFVFAMASCERYLDLYKHSFADVTRATVIAAEDVPRWLVASLWQWCTKQTCDVFDVVAVNELACGEHVRVALECHERAEE